MNTMFADFDGGQISRTDYFQSRDCEEGRAWLAIHGGCWHVLIPPRCSCRPSVARARPVVDHDELEGWRWRLEIAGQRFQLPRRQILSYRPALPPPFHPITRTLHLYASETRRHGGQSVDSTAPRRVGVPPNVPSVSKASKPSAFGFGRVEPGVQLHGSCRLLLIRESEAALKRRRYEPSSFSWTSKVG